MADKVQPEVEISTIGGNCPVQAEGIIDGFGFYFRARGTRWSLTVYDGSKEGWYYEEEYSQEEFAAGWMEQDEARGFIAKAAALFAAQSTKALHASIIDQGRKVLNATSDKGRSHAEYIEWALGELGK